MEWFVGLAMAGLTLIGVMEQRKTLSREIELLLWEGDDKTVQGRIILRNGSRARAVIDLLRVASPERSKIAWHARKSQAPAPTIATLEHDGVTDELKVRLDVLPGQDAGVSFVIGLPYSVATLDQISVECRLFPKDRLMGLIPKEWRRVTLPTRLIRRVYKRPGGTEVKKPRSGWLRDVPRNWLG